MGAIDKLYLKYRGKVQRHLEEDPYYQYLLELIASGRPTITQVNRVLDKSVDEKWLEAIETAIPSIHEIIAHPRRFLTTVEDLKPVEKVSKIGPSTVQHLASHTQYITGMRGGSVYPGKLLTLENEESLDLYENRFISTLIRKLGEFIEKRTGALFWDAGDEQSSLLRMESTMEDDYEIIEYKLDMTIHSKQTYLENDAGKLEVFKRIDRVRRVIADFKQSAFMSVMAGTAAVRSPIQRTNLITKNPDYRKCYDLWQFLERYDQVGYAIDVRETALDFDEDYLFQMYGNIALGYTVFKSLLDTDRRRITESPKRRKSIKPKFIKQIVEEFVDDYDLPDVEIRKVIVEEVTKAQAEIERRTQEIKDRQAAETEAVQNGSALPIPDGEVPPESIPPRKPRRPKLTEEEREKAKLAKAKELETARAAKENEKAQEKAKLEKAKELEKTRAAKEKEKEREKARLEKAKELEKARAAKEKEKEREKAKLAKAKELEKTRAAKEKEKEKEREKTKLAKAKELEKARAAKEREKEREKAKLAKAKELEKTRAAKEKELEKARAATERELEKARAALEREKEKARTSSVKSPAAGRGSTGVRKPPVPTPETPPEVLPLSEPELPAPPAPEESPIPALPEEHLPEDLAPAPEPEPESVPEPGPAPESAPRPINRLAQWIRRRRGLDQP
jgi:exonuclease SbcC